MNAHLKPELRHLRRVCESDQSPERRPAMTVGAGRRLRWPADAGIGETILAIFDSSK